LFRWPDPGKWFQKSYTASALAAALNEHVAGNVDAVGIDNVERVYGLAPVGSSGLRLTLSSPRDALLAPHREALARNASVLALIALVGFAIALALAEVSIRRPLTALAGVAERMRGGDMGARSSPPYSRDELGVVARSFDAMADAIDTQIAALREGDERTRASLALTREAEQRVRQQLEHMNLLDQITRSIGERLDLQSIFQVVVRTLEDSLPVDFCCVALHDSTTNTLRVERIGVKSEPLARALALEERTPFGVDNNGLARCMAGRLVHEPDISNVHFPFPQRLAQGGLRSLVLAPLRLESSVFGVLVAARREANAFTSAECEFLRQLSEHVGLGAGQAQLHDALRQAYEDLRQSQQVVMQEERLRALGQMASGIAHDINNALSPVSLYTESLLETEPGLSERARGYLVTIQRAVDDVAQTVARMREFYRQREPQIELVPVSLNELAQQVLDLTRAGWKDMALRQGIVISGSVELAPDLPQVTGIESEIREALTNLVMNAIDSMPEGGTLTIRTRVRHARGGAPRDGVVIEVIDNGAGMDDDTLRRCLEPFFTTKGERGTGLGLAMVFGTVRRHGGELEIDSKPGRGTTARIVFAVRSGEPAVAGAAESMRGAPTRLRLLLVDDDPVLLKSLTDTLEGDGHVIVSANGGKAGIAAFNASLDAKRPFAAVITDLGMPHIDGRKVASAVKHASPATPVILLTGWGQRLVAEGDIPACVDRVLSKPPKLRDIRDTLGELCQA
ncbi:MAG: ATP-binding protein, partial [Casimicrobiaceae bacterium]